MAKKNESPTIDIGRLTTETVQVCLLGTEPLICNRMSEKARREIIAPKAKMNAIEKAMHAKHDPATEYRNSVYRILNPACPALIALPSTAFKGAMATAALDLPGTKKAQIGRLVWVKGTYVPIFGTPQLLMSVVRSANMNGTPDIRTRAILPRWACALEITYVTPVIQQDAITNLIGAAGITAGVGDWRQEKGKGSFGQFTIVDITDPEFTALRQEGREAQLAALDVPVCFDDETASLLTWHEEEMLRRERTGRMPKRAKATKTDDDAVVVQ